MLLARRKITIVHMSVFKCVKSDLNERKGGSSQSNANSNSAQILQIRFDYQMYHWCMFVQEFHYFRISLNISVCVCVCLQVYM